MALRRPGTLAGVSSATRSSVAVLGVWRRRLPAPSSHRWSPTLRHVRPDPPSTRTFSNDELLDACNRVEPGSVDEPDTIDRQIAIIQKMMDERNLDNFSNDTLRDACIELVEIYETGTQINPTHA